MKPYSLEERVTLFAENIVQFCKSISPTFINKPIIVQLLRSSTSVGANYSEANGASSLKDFRFKISLCKKEIQESKYWLRILKSIDESKEKQIQELWDESLELTKIFQKIHYSSSQKLHQSKNLRMTK